MKISNEVKVGVLTIVAISLGVFGFNFLKGKDLFNKSNKLYAVFSDLGSLDKSNAVKINGLSVGNVYNFKEKDKNLSAVIVEIHLTRDINIPKNSVAYISSGILGGAIIVIERGDSNEYLSNGETIDTREDLGLLGSVQSQISPALNSVTSTLDTLKIVLSNMNKIFDNQTKGNIQDIVENLKQTSTSLNSMLNNAKDPLASSLNNFNAISSNLKKNNDSITAIINNAKRVTQKLSDLELQGTIDNLDNTITELKTSISKMNSKDGTLGLLMNDTELYRKLTSTVSSAEILLDDLRVHPKRYVSISVFGKKDKTGPLTAPTKKDSTQAGK
jgi:phospholipid/cholesterol/gamma-HCH transport system substrate-binding protein